MDSIDLAALLGLSAFLLTPIFIGSTVVAFTKQGKQVISSPAEYYVSVATTFGVLLVYITFLGVMFFS